MQIEQKWNCIRRLQFQLAAISTLGTRFKLNELFICRDYPFDAQTCGLRFYTSPSMQEVELSLYYQMNPTVVLCKFLK